RLGASAIGAVGLASMLFFGVGVFAMGVLLGLDPLVAQNFGAGRVDECHRWLVDGVWLGVFVAVPTVALIYAIRAALGLWGLPPDVEAFVRPYLGILTWSLPPLLLYVAFRRYLQAMHLVRPITIALLSANLVNAIGNWLLIFGHLGFPAMGVRGSAWATLIARVFMAAFLFVAILRHEAHVVPRLRDAPRGIDVARLRRLFALGIPAAGQMVFEVGVFSAATVLAGRVSADALAAHQIALNMAAFTFMVPVGLPSAAAGPGGPPVRRARSAGAGRPSRWASVSWRPPRRSSCSCPAPSSARSRRIAR